MGNIEHNCSADNCRMYAVSDEENADIACHNLKSLLEEDLV
jgi:hypothetical protein